MTEQPPNLDDLRSFWQIASCGGISAAADRFGASKAGLSRALTRLETISGTLLFDRIRGGLRITEFGEEVLAAATGVVDSGREAEEMLRVGSGVPRGRVRVAASAVGARLLLAPVVGRLAGRHPGISYQVTVTSAWPNPLADDYDIVLRVGRPSAPYLVARRLFASTPQLFVSRATARRVDTSDPKVVAGLGRIVVGAENVPKQWTLRNEDGHVLIINEEPLATVDDPLMAASMLESGAGVALLGSQFGRTLGATCERALPDYSAPDLKMYAILPPRRARLPAVRVFLDELQRYIKDVIVNTRT